MYISDLILSSLAELSSDRIRMFFASTSERYISFYNEFSKQDNYGDTSLMRDALDLAWRSAAQKDINLELLEQTKKKIVAIAPNDFHDSVFANYALPAVVCVCHSLDLCLDPEAVAGTIEYVLEPIEMTLADEFFGVWQVFDDDDKFNLFRARAQLDRRYIREADNIRNDLDELANPNVDDVSVAESLKARSQTHQWTLDELIGSE